MAAPYDCRACGACCREAFDTVEVDEDDPFLRRHPGLVARTPFGRWGVVRCGSRCAALRGGPGDFTCRVYAERPRPCRDLEVGGPACRWARARVGLPVDPPDEAAADPPAPAPVTPSEG